MPDRSDIERLLAKLAAARANVEQTLWELQRFAGDVPMIDGAVVPATLWAEFKPRFDALRMELEDGRAEAARTKRLVANVRHTRTLRLCCAAELIHSETEEPTTVPELLERCAGARDLTHWEDSELGAPVVPLEIAAVVEYGPPRGLEVVISIALARDPIESELAKIFSRLDQLSYHGWALNYELALPDDLAREYRLRFELPPKHHEIVAA
jgi:hypothetical protein